MRPSLLLLALPLLVVGCDKKVAEPDANPVVRKEPVKQELKIVDDVVGTGKEAHTGDSVKVNYTGKLKDGTVFDSSKDAGQPFEVTLGEGAVIKGWDEGIPGMKVGGKRTLTIPPSKAYGDAGSPPKIPPHATLTFEIELLGVEQPDE